MVDRRMDSSRAGDVELRDFRRKMEKNGKASQETMACIHVRI
jgi:hypothetical protein